MPAQPSHLSTGKGMRGGRTVLNPANMQRSCSEVDLFPAKITDFGCSQSVAECGEDHQCIARALPISAGALDQLLDLTNR